MIQSRELRLGNLVSLDGAGFGAVTELKEKVARVKYRRADTGEIHYSLVDYQYLEVITITEEILLKLWFHNKVGSIFEIEIDNGWYLNWESNYIFLNYKENECEISHNEIKYLHQLQNLYFALTGKELNVSELI